MSKPKFGTLKEVDIRELWKHEQYDFSAWLAEDDNICYLNDVLGLNLVDIKKEEKTGAYKCDIVARDEFKDIKVIVENQLEQSNHDHLGKIITYASGLNASVIVWIVKEAREEHRSAIEWLNNHTDEDVSFFLLEIHAFRIGDSAPAPKFEIIEQPNGYRKASSDSKGLSEADQARRQARINFWSVFNEIIKERGTPFNVRKPTPDHWYDIAIGRSDAHLSVTAVNKDSYVGVELYINDDKDLFDELYKNHQAIDSEFDFKLDWQRLDDKKASRIKSMIPGLNFENPSNYKDLMNEAINRVIKMRDVFKKYM